MDSEYCVCGKKIFFGNLKSQEIIECPNCKVKHICIEQSYKDENGDEEMIRDLYLTDEYNKYETVKRYFKDRIFSHAVKHGNSIDYIKWDDLVKVGTGSYKDVKIIDHYR